MALSESDTYNSLRIGLSSQLHISKPLTLTSEAAYVPVVVFNGLDMHNARALIGPEHSSHGDGAMLETSLDYRINKNWGVGLGGRYWMWNMRKGSIIFDFLGDTQLIVEPARFNTTRYGGFLQLKYRPKTESHFDSPAGSMNWGGFFVGGELGCAWGNSTWFDPFGSTTASSGYMNVAGFGDKIQSTGPLAGAHLDFNWQAGRFVYGFGGSIDASNIKGENTLFSGLGGVNGQTKIHYLGTFVGKIGTTVDRTLLYVNTGPAVLNTQYQLNGNTNVLTLGTGVQSTSHGGWTSGVGAMYAFSNHWASGVEYDYVGFGKQSISIPSVEPTNTAHIAANQSLSMLKLSVNYKVGVA